MREDDPLKDEIRGLLDKAQKGTETVQEFAWIALQNYRKQALAIRTEENVEVCRARLVERLQKLLAWASKTGRL